MKNINLDLIKEANHRIGEYIRRTPLIQSQYLSDYCRGQIYLKLENQQLTNSFKIRGAFNKLLQLSAIKKKRGVITASSGNHAQGIGLAATQFGIPARIVVPSKISEFKLNRIKQYNVDIIKKGDYDEVETIAKKISTQDQLVYISPYNDPQIINGQGTVGLEIIKALDNLDLIIVPVGGGGLISGISVAVKSMNHTIKVIGVQTKGASTVYESWKLGKITYVEEQDTLAEGLLGGIEQKAVTFDLILENVDEIALVKEENIKNAIRLLWEKEGQIIEGAGATVVAYLLEQGIKLADKNIVAVISGGNINEQLFQQIIS